ncbi:ChrR family anti-sigma-E factor [Aliikangiella sp. IMCC44653]
MKHHPDIDLLLKYSNGQLAPALSIAIGLHQQECETCQQQIQQIEAVAGSQLDQVEGAQVSLDDFEKLFARAESLDCAPLIDDGEAYAIASDDRPLFEKLGQRDFSDIKWQRLSFNIWRSKVDFNDGQHAIELLKFAANTKIPKHTHTGNEYTFVLQGDFSDIAGEYPEGAFIAQDGRHEHQPVAGKNGCICLAITDSPLKFSGALGPVLNWLNR